MKWLYLLTGGILGFLLGSTIEFFHNFDKDYDFDLGDENV
jgi:hypothetical protein